MKTLFWLRNDFRLHDNPALNAASRNGEVVVVYILEKQENSTKARDWWLHHTLIKFSKTLKEYNIPLLLCRGNPLEIIPNIIKEQNVTKAYWNRRYTPNGKKTDHMLLKLLKKENIYAKECAGNLLKEPEDIVNKQGEPFKVFTPMFQTLYRAGVSLPIEKTITLQKNKEVKSKYSCSLEAFNLVDETKTWHRSFDILWQVGEEAALKKLYTFLEEHLLTYKEGRDFPAKQGTSLLSPHLHFGEISAKTVWKYTLAFAYTVNAEDHPSVQSFLSELAWRDFAYQQLTQYTDIDTQPIKSIFSNFPWAKNGAYDAYFTAWKRGETGIPLVDAGMRELWKTGYMHNRVRMVTASFLTKNLLIPWQKGAEWFMDTLIDADEASNSASWQWVAGCGLDAAPYFRVFNPETQAKRFDPQDIYIRKWIPEYGTFAYPEALVDLKETRQNALDAYASIQTKSPL